MGSRSQSTAKPEALSGLLKGKRSMLIVLQDHPDPDALAAAAALREFSHRVSTARCTIASGGTVGRAENRALTDYLGLKVQNMARTDLARFSLLAMVDTQPGTGNNALPDQVVPDVVIDHHPVNPRSRRVPFRDIRPRYGATSTILHEYLAYTGMEPDTQLATALIYGIRSDTQDFGRESTRADIDAYGVLYPLANKRMLAQIQRGRAPAGYFRTLADGLARAQTCGRCIFSGLGEVDHPDMVAEVADLLLRHEGMNWALCWGHHGGRVTVSLRTDQTDKRADRVVRRIVGRDGTGGGHRSAAGGQIAMSRATEAERERVDRRIRTRFLRITGNEGKPIRKLVRPGR